MSKPLKYEKALYCSVCEKLVGSRPLIDMELSPGTQVNIIYTCKECGKPTTDIPEFLKGLLNKRNNG